MLPHRHCQFTRSLHAFKYRPHTQKSDHTSLNTAPNSLDVDININTSARHLNKQNGTPQNKVASNAIDDKLNTAQTSTWRHAKRNALGVQLLSRDLHAQIFKKTTFSPPPPAYVQISREHLQTHGLDPAQASVLPDTSFQLPPLQGNNLSEHFHRIGMNSAHPWLELSTQLSVADLPPKPAHWDIQSGWTKYHFRSDGSSYSESVPFPAHNGVPEQMLVFDVETMPRHHPYAILACAASPNAWYTWISPWLLEESSDPQQLIPFGDTSTSKIVVGHNVSYDRIRLREEYTLEGTRTRFLDTMALHVAVKGISSHQRPAWLKHRKLKDKQITRQQEAVDVILGLLSQVNSRIDAEEDPAKLNELIQLRSDMSDSLATLQSQSRSAIETDAVASTDITTLSSDDVSEVEQRWEDITSANSLADVARLHCGIMMDKSVRDDLMVLSPSDIRADIHDYLDYCSEDVRVTHCVFGAVFPLFRRACPHPVSLAGILTMGSGFLPVNEEWEAYLARAEGVYKDMEQGVLNKLKQLAEDARILMDTPEKWQRDVWLSQLDWTPKVAGKSRGIFPPDEVASSKSIPKEAEGHLSSPHTLPKWYAEITADPVGTKAISRILPLLLNLSYENHILKYTPKEGWYYTIEENLEGNEPTIHRLPSSKQTRTTQILSARHAISTLRDGRMSCSNKGLAEKVSKGERGEEVKGEILELAKATLESIHEDINADKIPKDPWLSQLDWTPVEPQNGSSSKSKPRSKAPKADPPPKTFFPKWYWDLTKPKKGFPPGSLDITPRSRVAPTLLRLSWRGWPLFHSREHGWVFRVPAGGETTPLTVTTNEDAGQNPPTNVPGLGPSLSFYDPADDALAEPALRGGFSFHKLPHKDGERANVGSPLAKTFVKHAQDGTLCSPGDEAREALEMNAQCSYWISARDRIMNQMVVWQTERMDLGYNDKEMTSSGEGISRKWGVILPQVITMGTVTRRAIEKTWLTASNAKKNRVGSELKAMVRAPPGYAIVGADVDSEELWISSCMGDAQFGLHGATALGWMTLEGTKAAGTDLHSKTASILGITRDQAKVFNYSRIYGAGMRHAVLLLLQANPGMAQEEAQRLAERLYASTKGRNTHRQDIFERKFWFGGSESYVFNKLEEIALSDTPQTPALGCGVTHALSRAHLPAAFGEDYMPSRINWVVQSSGVDYLHMLIVAMDYLLKHYDIRARYLISVHDELRYLVREEDKYRAALALQIANLWTRAFFAYKLGMDDLPQGVAFFSAVDIDHVLRKEVDMPCVTPSQPTPIPPGESLDIAEVLAKTGGGSLWADHRPMSQDIPMELVGSLEGYLEPDCMVHRARSAAFLRAQATTDFGEVKGLAQKVYGRKFDGSSKSKRKAKKATPLGNGEGYDWSETVERLLKQENIA